MCDITPDRFQRLFGNVHAALGDYIRASPTAIEGFGRALVRATHLARDPANRDEVLRVLREANPQEGDAPNVAGALLDAVLAKGVPHDAATGWGYYDPEHWQAWLDSRLSNNEMAAPLPDLSAASTDDFIAAWNAPR